MRRAGHRSGLLFTEGTAAQYVALGDLFQEQTERTQAALNTVSAKASKAAIERRAVWNGPNALDRILECHPNAGSSGRDPAVRRLRNWLHDRTLSGDILVEQNIHLIDVNNWVLGSHPVSAQVTGGRAGHVDQGDCWSHYNVNYTYPNQVHMTVTPAQFILASWDVAIRYFGTGGNAEMHYDAPVRITGPQKWEFPGLGAPAQSTDASAAAVGAFKGALDDADAMKQKHFIESIVSGKFLNQARQGAESTLIAMLGRQAAHTGRTWKWDELLALEETWDSRIDVAKLV